MANVLLLLLLLAVPHVATVSELPDWHLKPIGSHVKPNKVDETFPDSMITPEQFARNYVVPRKPLVFRDVAKKWPAFTLWTDDYLTKHYGDMELRLEAKKEKGGNIPKGDISLGRDTLKTFLKDYQTGVDKYVVSELPTPMWKDVHVPPPMGCGEFVKNFVEIDVWMNSDMGKSGKGGNSILHKDAFNQVNCVVNGTKDWKLFELKYNDFIYQSWEGPSEAGYGGFSLVNPDKVDAKEFPKFGKIPEWQLTRINAGDCLYLPSQMWHQVKSYGESNKAVSFLVSRYDGRENINTTDCPDIPSAVRLSDVDVDLQYPGSGLMTMGDNEIEDTAKHFLNLVVGRKGFVTKRNVFKMVFEGNRFIAKQKEVSVKKAKEFYQYLLSLADGDKKKMTLDFVSNLTRAQVRAAYKWIFREEPSNSYNYEFSHISPDVISQIITTLQTQNDGELKKHEFTQMYESAGGTNKFAENFWKKLAGDEDTITDISRTIGDALEPYEYYRLEEEEDEDENEGEEEKRITTPQGHLSEPKKRKGTFNHNYEDREHVEENYDRNDIVNNDGDIVEENDRIGGDSNEENTAAKDEL